MRVVILCNVEYKSNSLEGGTLTSHDLACSERVADMDILLADLAKDE